MTRKTLFLPVLMLLLAGFTLTRDRADEARTPQPALTDLADWQVDHVHSKLSFKARHFGISNVRGEFQDYDASISFEPEDLSTLQASVRVRAASVFTGNDRRDNHLRSDDFFNAEVDSIITFTSTGVRNIDGDSFELVGDLTIRGHTREVVLDAAFLGTVSMERGGEMTERAAFEAETKVNRFDYGLKFDSTVGGAGDLVVGEEVTLIIELELVKQAA